MCIYARVYNYVLLVYHSKTMAKMPQAERNSRTHTQTSVYICINIWMGSGSFAFLLLNSLKHLAQKEPPNIIFIYAPSPLHSEALTLLNLTSFSFCSHASPFRTARSSCPPSRSTTGPPLVFSI